MSFAIVYTRAMIGTEAPLVTVEAHISAGLINTGGITGNRC